MWALHWTRDTLYCDTRPTFSFWSSSHFEWATISRMDLKSCVTYRPLWGFVLWLRLRSTVQQTGDTTSIPSHRQAQFLHLVRNMSPKIATYRFYSTNLICSNRFVRHQCRNAVNMNQNHTIKSQLSDDQSRQDVPRIRNLHRKLCERKAILNQHE